MHTAPNLVWSFQIPFFFYFLFLLFLFVHSCGYLGLCLCGWSSWGEIWYMLRRVGYDHPCVSFVFSCGYLGLFSWWCVYVNMCVLLIVWGAVLCWDLCVNSFLVSRFCIVYCVLCFRFCWCCGSLPHNEGIVRFRCGGGVTLPTNFIIFFCVFGGFCTILVNFDPFYRRY